MTDDMDRRSFLGVATLTLGALVSRPEAAIAGSGRVSAAPEFALSVRPEIHSAAGQAMLPALRAGVAAMKAKHINDPTGWWYQANMHGTYDTPTQLLWETCQHGQFFFLSWHRMYLYYFEQILRAASGNPAFALPYWDYGPAAQRHLPLAFRSPATAANSLYEPDRSDGMNDGSGELPGVDVDYSWSLDMTAFNGTWSAGGFAGKTVSAPQHFSGGFGGLEWMPHNAVHGDIGGLMGDPNTAAKDPIFWLHHANIDRLWNRWIAMKGGRANPTTPPWTTTKFSFFRPDGSVVQLSGAEVVDSASQLNYRYDTDTAISSQLLASLAELKNLRVQKWPVKLFEVPPRPWPPVPPGPWKEMTVRSTAPLTIGPGQVQTAIEIPASVRQQFRQATIKSALATRSRRLVLALEGLDVTRPPGGNVDVFVVPGRPDGENLVQAVTQPNGEFYAGTLDFFGLFGQLHTSGQRGIRGATVIVEMTEQLQKLLGTDGADGSRLSVVFRPRGGGTTERPTIRPLSRPFTVGRVAIRAL